MTEQDKVIENIRKKYILSISSHTFNAGVIVLLSLIFGLVFYQFQPIPPSVKPQDIQFIRQGFGGLLGLYIAVSALFVYAIWNAWRYYKASKEIEKELFKAAINSLKK